MSSREKPDQEKRPEGAHEDASDQAKGRGSQGGEQTPKTEEKDPQTGEPQWKEDIKKQTGGG